MRRLLVLAGSLVLVAGAPAEAALVELVKVGHRPFQPGNRYVPGVPPTDFFAYRVTADPGDDDDLRMEGLRVTATTPLRAGEGCRSDAPGSVVCEPRTSDGAAAFVGTPAVELGDGSDRLVLVKSDANVVGGAGDDVLETAPGLGGRWDGGPGADRLVGGSFWTVDYGARTAPVAASLDGVANDGEAGEGDDVGAAAPVVVGGGGDDRLRGGTRPVTLKGGAGNDVLESVGTVTTRSNELRESHAVMEGGSGADRLLSGPGSDELAGGEGDDDLAGGDGTDLLAGGPGADRADGGRGDDTLSLDARGDGGADFASGGDGVDGAHWFNDSPARPRLVVNLGDDRGPDGIAGEQDALAGDVENAASRGMGFIGVTGTGGPNELTFTGRGAVDGAGGDDELRVNNFVPGPSRPTGRTRIVPGPGADRVWPGTGTSVLARDGEADTIECELSDNARDLVLDAGLDRATPCSGGLSLGIADDGIYRRVRAGRRAAFAVYCQDRYHPCRVRMWPRFRGRRLRPLRLLVPAGGHRGASVRIPRDAAPGRAVVTLTARVASPFRGVPAWRDRGLGVYVRVLRR